MAPPGYRRLAHREIYSNPWVRADVHEIVHPTGAAGEHLLIATGRASGVLVVERDHFIFARQPRFAADRVVLEIVKGGAEEGESAEACAKRELREELGLTARTWTPLGEAYELPSIVERPVALFVARDLSRVPSAQESVEQIHAVRMPIAEAFRAARDGGIDDAVTLAALLRFMLTSER